MSIFTTKASDVRRGQKDHVLTKEEFRESFLTRYYDPAFDKVSAELEKVMEIAWDGYKEYRKSPRTEKIGPGHADPEYEAAIEWIATKNKLAVAEQKQKDPASPNKILIICASSRNDQTCPGEMSKTYRLAKIAEEAISKNENTEIEFLDLSGLTSEYGKKIYPCKSCVSTSMALCHWPCSCYPNHARDQAGDWMAEIYEKWVSAHGVMIVTPVAWYQAPSVLKLMIDRLVCADGGNADPSSTGGKDPKKAKALELEGWDYPKHLKGRVFSVIVHGDAAGTENLRRILTDWLNDMELVQAGDSAVFDRYIGYLKPYATSHEDLDKNEGIQTETRNAAISLFNSVGIMRKGLWPEPDQNLVDPDQK